jgi:hypothetical protein
MMRKVSEQLRRKNLLEQPLTFPKLPPISSDLRTIKSSNYPN